MRWFLIGLFVMMLSCTGPTQPKQVPVVLTVTQNGKPLEPAPNERLLIQLSGAEQIDFQMDRPGRFVVAGPRQGVVPGSYSVVLVIGSTTLPQPPAFVNTDMSVNVTPDQREYAIALPPRSR